MRKKASEYPGKEGLAIIGFNLASENCWIAILVVHADAGDPISY